MKKPMVPPDQDSLLAIADAADRLLTILQTVNTPTVDGGYLHWDKLRFHTPPDGLSHEEWWLGLKFHRSNRKAIPLVGKSGRQFSYTLTEPIPERLHEIDLDAGGTISNAGTNHQSRHEGSVLRQFVDRGSHHFQPDRGRGNDPTSCQGDDTFWSKTHRPERKDDSQQLHHDEEARRTERQAAHQGVGFRDSSPHYRGHPGRSFRCRPISTRRRKGRCQ